MKKIFLASALMLSMTVCAQERSTVYFTKDISPESLVRIYRTIADTLRLSDVVVTGTRNTTDIRHLPQTVTVVGRDKLTENGHTEEL